MLSLNALRPRLDAAPPAKVVPPVDAVPGLTPLEIAQFRQGQAQFALPEVAPIGLGPIFNGRSCGECHPKGGGSERISFIIGDGPQQRLLGGPVIQIKAIHGFSPEQIPDSVPVAQRRAMTTQGLGLVGAIPDAAILAEQIRQQQFVPLIAGKANVVIDAVTGRQRIGRIRQKSQHPNSASFAAEAYLREMGITTPFFPDEEAAYNNPANLHGNPAPRINNNGKNVVEFGYFMDYLAPPPRKLPKRKKDQELVAAGEAIFSSISCAECHKPVWITGSHSSHALAHKELRPYSDFLLHDMGASGDQVQQGTSTNNQPIPGSWMRTTPLWGCGNNSVLWHDGRIKQGDFAGAINQHAGQGLAAKIQFQALSHQQNQALLAFLGSL
jgi:CxxC motif-containing protein (DUF1111 family)